MRKDYIGFGYNPKESDNHFYVVIPGERTQDVEIYERFHWDDEVQEIKKQDVLKLREPRYKWSKVVDSLAKEFNQRLKAEKKPVGKFKAGEAVPLEKLYGKEMMVLLWGIENNDPAGIPTAIRNWLGLQPEERWWLYTMTNASTGGINDKRGWRTALRYALCENPVDEPDQMTIDQLLGGI